MIPSNTFKTKISNAGALQNKPGVIMQAAFNDPRVRTVKSRHNIVPLIVTPAETGHQLECQCAVFEASGSFSDTIAGPENLQCLLKYLEEERERRKKKVPAQ